MARSLLKRHGLKVHTPPCRPRPPQADAPTPAASLNLQFTSLWAAHRIREKKAPTSSWPRPFGSKTRFVGDLGPFICLKPAIPPHQPGQISPLLLHSFPAPDATLFALPARGTLKPCNSIAPRDSNARARLCVLPERNHAAP